MSLALAGLLLTCVSCSEAKPTPPRVTVTDTAAVGEGLKVIGFAARTRSMPRSPATTMLPLKLSLLPPTSRPSGIRPEL